MLKQVIKIMNTTRIKKKLTITGIILAMGLAKPMTNVEAKEVKTYIFDNEELHNYCSNASIEDLMNSLNQNKILNDKYKTYIEKFINIVYKKYPNIDYSIFNQNLKTLEIIEVDTFDKSSNDVKGTYKIYENKIYLLSNLECEEYILFHELWHTFSIIYLSEEKALKSPSYGFAYGTALTEGMTAYLTNTITKDEYMSYDNQVSIIEMLVEIYGKDIISQYLDFGITEMVYNLSKNSDYEKASLFVKTADKDLNNKATNEEIINNYKYLIDIYCEDISSKTLESISNFQKAIMNLKYNLLIEKEIINYLKKYYSNVIINDDMNYIIFNTKESSKVFLLNNVYVIRASDNQNYFVNSNIMKKYIEEGIIRNIYSEEQIKLEYTTIYSITPLKEYITNNLLDIISIHEDKIYIDANLLEQKYEEEKILTK